MSDTQHAHHIVIYTDGACKGNPGPGGWGAVLRSGGHEKHLHGGAKLTTNNRMEISAVIHALRALKQASSVELWTDSQYVQKGVTEWLEGWKKRGWKTASKEPVRMPTSGKNWMNCSPSIKFPGIGSEAIQATQATN